MWKEKGSEGLDDKVFAFFQARAIVRILHYFSSRIISAFKEHSGKFRPELQYSKACKTVSGPKIHKDVLFRAQSQNR